MPAAASTVAGETAIVIPFRPQANNAVSLLLEWYSDLRPGRVDLTGEFAGRELFMIEGDSLLRHIFGAGRVDMNEGLQLLHAVAEVERFLFDLKKRNCHFHVVFINEHRHLCVPEYALSSQIYKFLYARECIIRHLMRFNSSGEEGETIQFFKFESSDSEELGTYLKVYRPYFILTHDGAFDPLQKDYTPGRRLAPETMMLRIFIWRMMEQGFQIALINEILFSGWRVTAFAMNEGKLKVYKPQVSPFLDQAVQTLSFSDPLSEPNIESLSPWTNDTDTLHKLSSEREILHILALRQVLASNKKNAFADFVGPFLYHLSLLQYLKFDERRIPDVVFDVGCDKTPPYEEFFKDLLTVETYFLRVEGKPFDTTKLNIYDAIDGRLFRLVLCKWSNFGKDTSLCPHQVVQEHYKTLCGVLGDLVNEHISHDFRDSRAFHGTINETSAHSADEQTIHVVLPFNNPIFDPHFSAIQLRVADQTVQSEFNDGLGAFEAQVCQVKSKSKAIELKKLEWWELKGQQRFQANIQRYAASLTGASGKELKPERIITDSTAEKPSQAQKQVQRGSNTHPQKKDKVVTAEKKKKGGGTKKTAEAIKEANALAKAEEQSKKALLAWKTFRTQTLDGIKGLREKLIVLDRYFQGSVTDPVVRMEAKLLRIYLLLWIWAGEYCAPSKSAEVQKSDGYGIPALIFYEARQLIFNPLLTKPIKKCVEAALRALGITPPKIPETSQLPDKPLTLQLDSNSFKVHHADTKVGMDLKEFQLRCCGQYMDRNLDSKEDARVAFTPDAWQVKVLDALDADKSVFIVAPTSAGKTFIGYYAMEKVNRPLLKPARQSAKSPFESQILKADDEGVLVYVAPTKTLANQIAAELQARFIKDYKHRGKSLWSIAIREYTIHNPLSCQILITVPYVLQTMLLSPQNAKTWTPKIKRIILDEIHCLGSEEDGEVWEQLVLLAPCPIVAMSATVGNPKEFHQWLQATQKRLKREGKHGKEEQLEVVLIEHKYRFNDLRKYHYHPAAGSLSLASSTEIFKGLAPTPSTFGIEMSADESFQLVHPITAIGDKISAIPDDLTLESADCLTLFSAMCKVQTEKYKVPDALNYMKFFPDVIKKADVIKWETRLKEVLSSWANAPESPFCQVIELLQPPSVHSRKEIEYVSDIIEDTSAEEQQETQEIDPKDDGAISIQSEQEKKSNQNSVQAINSILDMLSELNAKNALPAILFNYNPVAAEFITFHLIQHLISGEEHWRENSAEWKKKMAARETWLKQQEIAAARKQSTRKAKLGSRDKDEGDFIAPKEDRILDEQDDVLGIASFDPEEPSDGFAFLGRKVYSKEDLKQDIGELESRGKVNPILIQGIKRGIGCHHAALPRPYRLIVERLFRKGFLRVVISTGTLALGINMPCQTVCFIGGDLLLTPLNYRQTSGRAGRRGFDLLGNVIFHGLPLERVHKLMRSNLPDLVGHFPTSTTLMLRLFILLHGSGGSKFAKDMVDGLLSQAQLSVGDNSTRSQVLYCVRFSIEYLMRHRLLNSKGEPLTFAPFASSLHFEEPGNFVLTDLLRTGQLWKELNDLEGHPEASDAAKKLRSRKLMLILAHLFVRIRLKLADVYDTVGVLGNRVKPLPELPPRIASALEYHNQKVLDLTTTYAVTYAQNYIPKGKSPEVLPLTGTNPHPDASSAVPFSFLDVSNSPTYARSIFSTLSNHTDKFTTMHDIQTSSHPSIHYVSGWLPHIRIGTSFNFKLNPYLFEFFLNGGSEAKIAKTCRIRQSLVWFLLDDFKKVLVAITVALSNLVLQNGLLSWDDYVLTGEDDVDYHKLDEEVEAIKDQLGESEASSDDNWNEDGRDEGTRKRRELIGVYFAMREVQNTFTERFDSIAATKRVKKGKNYGKAAPGGGKGGGRK